MHFRISIIEKTFFEVLHGLRFTYVQANTNWLNFVKAAFISNFSKCLGKVTTSTQDSVQERFTQSTRKLNDFTVLPTNGDQIPNDNWHIKVN